VPLEILNKPGPLSEDEFAQIKLHPQAGMDLLRSANPSPLIVAAVRDHHERLDGSGYPAGRVAGTIHEFARICAIADVFDAITSERPYKHAAPAYVAVNFISQGGISGLFDAEIVSAFRRVCLPFPLGTEVVHDGDVLGIVSAIDTGDPWMPTVRRMQDGRITESVVDVRQLDVTRRPPDVADLAAWAA
jgi:HD-GYP domain-containing protein (c-di-GMP phosphodiesterase class II)